MQPPPSAPARIRGLRMGDAVIFMVMVMVMVRPMRRYVGKWSIIPMEEAYMQFIPTQDQDPTVQ
jgi:hypothetical protein